MRYALPFFLLLPASASAQVLYGSLVGNVTDASGAAVPNVTVAITHTQTGQRRQAETNELGVYNVVAVPSGTYAVEFAKSGFATSKKEGVEVSINNVTRVDQVLQIGAVAESVQVSAQAAVLQTDRAEVRREISSRNLVNLPVPPGRNYQQLLLTVPGVSPPQNAGSNIANPSRALVYNVNGTSSMGNGIRVDGTATNGVWLPWYAAHVPSIESIENVNVVTNSFDAEQGLAGGSAVNVQIKSGTNQLHGSAFEFHNNQHLQANRFFNPLGKKPKAIFNQFGGTVGGPIKRDKLFYFVSYEASLDRKVADAFGTVPTAEIRGGNMSASQNQIYDPTTGTATGTGRMPYPDKRVPASLFDPIIQKLVQLTPQPTLPGIANNFYRNWPDTFDRHTIDSKVNWNVNSRLNVYGRLSTLRYENKTDLLLGELGGSRKFANGHTYSTTFAGTYTFSPAFIVDANFGWNLLDTSALQNRIDEKLGLEFLGIPGTNGPRRVQGGWPEFNTTNYTVVGSSGGVTPIIWHDPAWQYTANANWLRGAHNVRFGFDASRQHMNHVTHELVGASGAPMGGFSFTGGVTALNGGPAPNQFNSYAQFLMGIATGVNKIFMLPEQVTTRAWLQSLYIRDQWQVSRRLTLSYGTRWEHIPMPTREDRGIERYDWRTNKMLICGAGSTPRDCRVETSNRLFAPRVGFAFRASDTFVIRSGYGISIDPYSLARPMRTNYPVVTGLNITPPNAFSASGRVRDGIPPVPVPNISSGVIDVPNFVVAFTLPDKFPRGYVQSWNFTMQKQLKWGWTGQAGYVATRQVRQLGYVEMNYGKPGRGQAGQPFFQQFGRPASTQITAPTGSSNYNALQANLERRFAAGYQVEASYTFSKSRGICCNDRSDLQPAINDPEFYRLNRSVNGFHRPHNFVVTGMAELPFGKGKRWASSGGAASWIAGGWRLNGIFSTFSGLPFSVLSANTSLNAPFNTQRADQVKSQVSKVGGVGRGSSFFDPFAYVPVTQARYGTAGFNSLRGPGLVNVDFGLARDFAINEQWRIQFRAEAFNATNTPHFGNPGGNVSNLQLNPDGTIRTLGGYTEITTIRANAREGVDERVFRLGLRLSF
ncbi:MAG: carboxypeptidase regulatory-like domain-containing protein [Acidobacteria bacterium]|nr:carboxypeptidase regulatory-like domain-containing protein [Acidobacteriota bacterium]